MGSLSPRSLVLVALLSGCMSTYSAPAPVVPLLNGRGDLAVSVMVRPVFPARAASAYVAAAPSEHIRVYAATSLSRAVGDPHLDRTGRRLKERNDTQQGELGAGWGTSGEHMRAEVLAGLGYGMTSSAQCTRSIDGDDPWCDYWVDGKSRFVRASAQGQAVASAGIWSGGGGVRLSFVHFQFTTLLGEDSDRRAAIAVVEPFLLQRFQVPFGFVQIMLDIPIVAYSPRVKLRDEVGNDGNALVAVTPRVTSKLVESPFPRLFLGYQLSLEDLWP